MTIFDLILGKNDFILRALLNKYVQSNGFAIWCIVMGFVGFLVKLMWLSCSINRFYICLIDFT